jgi:hypothetical protein
LSWAKAGVLAANKAARTIEFVLVSIKGLLL